MLTFTIPARTASPRASLGDARRAVQHQRHGHGLAQCGDEVEVESAVWLVMACELPTAAASASTPVARRIRRPGPGRCGCPVRAHWSSAYPCRRRNRARPPPRVPAAAAVGRFRGDGHVPSYGSARRRPSPTSIRRLRRGPRGPAFSTWSRCRLTGTSASEARAASAAAQRSDGAGTPPCSRPPAGSPPTGPLRACDDALRVLEGDHVEGGDAATTDRGVAGTSLAVLISGMTLLDASVQQDAIISMYTQYRQGATGCRLSPDSTWGRRRARPSLRRPWRRAGNGSGPDDVGRRP